MPTAAMAASLQRAPTPCSSRRQAAYQIRRLSITKNNLWTLHTWSAQLPPDSKTHVRDHQATAQTCAGSGSSHGIVGAKSVEKRQP
jgi:hypothetical protein